VYSFGVCPQPALLFVVGPPPFVGLGPFDSITSDRKDEGTEKAGIGASRTRRARPADRRFGASVRRAARASSSWSPVRCGESAGRSYLPGVESRSMPAKLLIAELERVREQRVLRPPVMLMRRAPNSNRARAAGSVVASARRGQSLVRTGALL
jgi:hypothetical protein